MTSRCRFCGATDRKITNEHVWPEWLADFLPGMPPLGQAERWSSGVGHERFRQPFLSATVRVFCEECNSGWMSDLENVAKPIVGPMVTGQALELDAAAQEIVANWVALKGLVAVQTSKVEQPIPEYHYGRVHHFRGAPPNTMRVWIGHHLNLADPDRPGHWSTWRRTSQVRARRSHYQRRLGHLA